MFNKNKKSNPMTPANKLKPVIPANKSNAVKPDDKATDKQKAAMRSEGGKN